VLIAAAIYAASPIAVPSVHDTTPATAARQFTHSLEHRGERVLPRTSSQQMNLRVVLATQQDLSAVKTQSSGCAGVIVAPRANE
jgi:hypothetical protein